MFSKLKYISNGIHFRVLMLVVGLAVTLVAAQFITDTIIETQKVRDQRLVEARSMTNVVARSLEKQFDYFELSDIEEILTSVRTNDHVKQISAVDRDFTFFLDGDPITPTLLPIGDNAEQVAAIETAKPSHSISDDSITVAEPLLRGGRSIGAVMIRFENPKFSEIMRPILQSNFFSLVSILSLGIILAGI